MQARQHDRLFARCAGPWRIDPTDNSADTGPESSTSHDATTTPRPQAAFDHAAARAYLRVGAIPFLTITINGSGLEPRSEPGHHRMLCLL